MCVFACVHLCANIYAGLVTRHLDPPYAKLHCIMRMKSSHVAYAWSSSHYTPFLQRHTGHWVDLTYKGDWLTRPIASNEIAPLVRVLVWVSRWLNHALGLDVPWKGEEGEEEAENVVQEGLRWARRRGYRCVCAHVHDRRSLSFTDHVKAQSDECSGSNEPYISFGSKQWNCFCLLAGSAYVSLRRFRR